MINFATQNPSEADFKSTPNLKARESGLADFPVPQIPVDPYRQLPAGGSQWAVPGYQQVIGLINQTFRSHFYVGGDEALKHCRDNAVACRKDPIVWQCLRQRQNAVVQLPWSLEPQDESDPEQMRAAAKNTLALLQTPHWQDFLRAIEERQWWGKAGVSCIFRWDPFNPGLMHIADWLPLNGDSLVPRWSGGSVLGDWGLMVNGGYEGDSEPYNLGRVHYFTPEEREATVIGSFEPEAPDYYDTLSTGSIKGLGLRSRVYWYWYLRTNLYASMLDFAERVGNGIWIADYDQSNPTGRQDMEEAVAAYRDRRVISRPCNQLGQSAYNLRILEPGASSIGVLQNLIAYLDTAIRSVISGHPVGDGVQIGVGGDTAVMYTDSVSQVTKGDANANQEILTSQLVKTLYRYNSPGVPNSKFQYATDHPGASRILEYARALRDMGYAVDLDSIAKICGVPKASMNANVSTKVQSVNPVAVESPPQGVPVAGQSAPAPQQGEAPQPTQSPT